MNKKDKLAYLEDYTAGEVSDLHTIGRVLLTMQSAVTYHEGGGITTTEALDELRELIGWLLIEIAEAIIRESREGD